MCIHYYESIEKLELKKLSAIRVLCTKKSSWKGAFECVSLKENNKKKVVAKKRIWENFMIFCAKKCKTIKKCSQNLENNQNMIQIGL